MTKPRSGNKISGTVDMALYCEPPSTCTFRGDKSVVPAPIMEHVGYKVRHSKAGREDYMIFFDFFFGLLSQVPCRFRFEN